MSCCFVGEGIAAPGGVRYLAQDDVASGATSCAAHNSGSSCYFSVGSGLGGSDLGPSGLHKEGKEQGPVLGA